RKNTEQDWLKTNLTKFTQLLQGQKDLLTVSRMILSELAPLVGAQHGVFFVAEPAEEDPDPVLRLLASYAYRERRSLANRFTLGEGLVGQCALERERILIRDVPTDYVKIASGLGEAAPLNIVALPVLFEGEVKAVIELASFQEFKPIHLTFLDQLTESIGIVLNTIEANMRTEDLLIQSQSLTQELQSQQKELTQTNQRLEQQARSLRESEELLKRQQEELQQTNTELQEKARLLAEQKSEVEQKNREIELARRAIEEKAEQLALTSKYKSEFLANMSHELRTPLNSMLILSKMLAENKEASLSSKQIEFAETIYSSGADLLSLINEILDLSKIESGAMAVEAEQVALSELEGDLDRMFRQMAENQGLTFRIEQEEGLPEALYTDPKRLQQILKNLLSNAFKFTKEGSVVLRMAAASEGIAFDADPLRQADRVVAFVVEDTGVGIPKDKQRVIFEAFQQADGTMSRTYGGTGLGLSISREIARMLGGEIHLESTVGEGSTFTLYLPEQYQPAPVAPARRSEGDGATAAAAVVQDAAVRTARAPAEVEARPAPAAGDGAPRTEPPEAAPRTEPRPAVEDDRDAIQPDDAVLLIVEDDPGFARVLRDVAHEKNFRVVVAPHGEAALALVRQYPPAAVLLDVRLPGMHGLTVLDRLKNDPRTRHIPVYILSVATKLPRQRRRGVVRQLTKPVTRDSVLETMDAIRGFTERDVRHLLVVEDDDGHRQSIVELLDGEDVALTAVGAGEEALVALSTGRFDCAVIDLGLPDMDGRALIEQIRAQEALGDLPIVVYTGRELPKDEAAALSEEVEALILKDVSSLDALLGETALYLHRAQEELPEEQRETLERLNQPEASLAGRRVLIIDDDIRNIFALTSLLERHQVEVLYAESGREGIEQLQQTPGIDAVLMDVMMPEMDGYETTRRIREQARFQELPIIAVTAKAMKGDREKCIEAGASDYITKPVNVEQLISLLRVWIHKQP
ncbi:MAG: response regulator, partial [Rhodothermales bacterium]|nr:response regulator [Rhodothermales bacterium]